MIQEAEGLTEVFRRMTTALPETADPREMLRFWIIYEYAKQGKPFFPGDLQMPATSSTTVLQAISQPDVNSDA
ncbi:hypothetical protein [Leptolyngbya sp. 7M]|uniref:hypothetical protein n=1 Tax=Leptolyngbya sp. 7M TaxID=2812896 RepID=UPI001B8C782A|nr:hypothetical protein [Leptolyngbya sp. 7M]QYO64851.1 hypothetical protein JVX88_35700 [Leptolyngbya sp. 7M]